VNPPVYDALDVPAVRAFAGSPLRAFAHGRVPQNTPRPYITFQNVGGGPLNTLSCLPDMDDSRVRVWCYSDETSGTSYARDFKDATRDALEAETHVVFGPVDEYEADTKLLVWIMDAEFWTDR
jgi:hypothetical protein